MVYELRGVSCYWERERIKGPSEKESDLLRQNGNKSLGCPKVTGRSTGPKLPTGRGRPPLVGLPYDVSQYFHCRFLGRVTTVHELYRYRIQKTSLFTNFFFSVSFQLPMFDVDDPPSSTLPTRLQ